MLRQTQTWHQTPSKGTDTLIAIAGSKPSNRRYEAGMEFVI